MTFAVNYLTSGFFPLLYIPVLRMIDLSLDIYVLIAIAELPPLFWGCIYANIFLPVESFDLKNNSKMNFQLLKH
jgi:hypothetical protein